MIVVFPILSLTDEWLFCVVLKLENKGDKEKNDCCGWITGIVIGHCEGLLSSLNI